jgi:uncharacterized protein
MRILFYFVHPAKYHLFRIVINELMKNSSVDIVINSKDVLEELIKNEGWEYTNIFPKGRNISSKPSIIKSGFKFILTVLLLEKFLFRHKKYNVFVTDDTLVVNGWWRRIPTYIFNDNDIETIRINKILFYFAYKIISPAVTNLGPFETKKISFSGNKALAHLHPDYFKPRSEILDKYNLLVNNFCIIRVSKINATHDIGNKGISDDDLDDLIGNCNKFCRVIISSERKINEKYKDFVFKGNPSDLTHLMYYAMIVVTDSATMASEAALMGTPNVLINKVGKKCSVNKDLVDNGLQYNFDSYKESSDIIQKILEDSNLRISLKEKAKLYLDKCDDLNQFLLKTISNHK